MNKNVFVQSQIACAMLKLEGMKAVNMQRAYEGCAMDYGYDDFVNLIDEHKIGWNDVIGYLRE